MANGFYEAVLGKIYAAMVTSGQGKGGDNKDMESVLNNGSGFDYMRMFMIICVSSHESVEQLPKERPMQDCTGLTSDQI